MIINLNNTTDLKIAKKISKDLKGKLIFDEIAIHHMLDGHLKYQNKVETLISNVEKNIDIDLSIFKVQNYIN